MQIKMINYKQNKKIKYQAIYKTPLNSKIILKYTLVILNS